jgi:hypothetical protein
MAENVDIGAAVALTLARLGGQVDIDDQEVAATHVSATLKLVGHRIANMTPREYRLTVNMTFDPTLEKFVADGIEAMNELVGLSKIIMALDTSDIESTTRMIFSLKLALGIFYAGKAADNKPDRYQ